jgi:hypothetical protein
MLTVDEELKLELLRKDHDFIIRQIENIDAQLRPLRARRKQLLQQLEDNERQWK